MSKMNVKLARTPRFLALCLVLCSSSVALAQAPISGSVDRAQLLRNSAPGLREAAPGEPGSDEGVAPASPNDPDLGEQAILKRAEKPQPFTFIASAPFSFTSNVALSSTDEKGDVLFTPSALLIYAPRISGPLNATFSVGQQMFYYDRFDGFNFGSFEARAGLAYTLAQFHGLVLRADYAFNRLTNDSFDEFFRSHTLDFAAEMPFRIGRAQQLTVGSEVAVDLASHPAPPGRNDYSAFVGYAVNLARNFSMNAVVRVAVRDYTEVDRLDVSEIFALSATYRINSYLSVSAITSFAHNDSDRDVFDYDVGNGGGALAANVRF